MNIILIILVFGVIVFFHEFGHFIVAKMNKISVTEFSIGMGPAIFSFTKKETKYSLRILPIGGYCLMLGEDEASDDENAFGNKSVWQRILVVAAGPFFNIILAFVFSVILVHWTGYDPATLTKVTEGDAAYDAGIKPGDTITKIDGKNIYNYRELLVYMEYHDVKEPIELVMERPDGTEYEVSLLARQKENGNYYLGVAGGYRESTSIKNDIKYAFLEVRYQLKTTLYGLRMIVTGQVKGDQVMGPVGVGGIMSDIIDEVKEESKTTKEVILNIILNMMNWCILLSVNLGIMNLLPIPALDGGRLLFLIIEAVRRKKLSQDKEAIVNLVGFALVMLLMIIVLFNDIKNIFI